MEIECSIDFKSVMNGVYGELTIGEDIYILDRLNQNYCCPIKIGND